jgi:hypothetical protein
MKQRTHPIRRIWRYAWALPNTAIGLLIGTAMLVLGGRGRVASGAIEFSGGLLARLMAAQPGPMRFCAITFGHVIIGLDECELDRVRAHEHVHVRQCERWGPFFLPAYLLSSLWQVL